MKLILFVFLITLSSTRWNEDPSHTAEYRRKLMTDLKKQDKMHTQITIRVGHHVFTATLQDDAPAQAFIALLPLTITMNELNGNEKYNRLSGNLPVATLIPRQIQAGDLMIWGADTLVLFYETFSTSYSYTRLGKINNPAGLAKALGAGDVKVVFEIL